MKLILLSAMMTGVLFAGDMLSPGSKAPDFTLKDEAGVKHSLSDYVGKRVVIYFYPKDDTPGCTAEACNIRDNYELLQKNNIVILGVSYDDSLSHNQFKEKYDLPFPLLSDTDKEVAKLYDAKNPLYGWMAASRITYIIDEKGFIIAKIDNVNTQAHSEQILEILKAHDQKSQGK